MQSTETEVRKPAFRYFTSRPDDTTGLWRTMYAIEQQLSLAHDYGEPSMVAFLADLNPDLDESIAADVERLLDMGEEIDQYESIRGVLDEINPLPVLVDDYVEHLRHLARLVRGIPSTPTRPRHVLGAGA